MVKIKLERKEILFALLGTIFILVYFLYLRNLISPYLSNLPIFVAWLIWQTGFVFGLYLIFSILGDSRLRLKTTLIVFLIGTGIDILAPPYMVSATGVINQNAEMWYMSVDSVFASLYSGITNIPPILGYSSVWFLTYIVTPILFIFILPVIIADPKLIKKVFNY